MNSRHAFQTELAGISASGPDRITQRLLRLVHGARPVSRADAAKSLNIEKTKLNAILKPLIANGVVSEDRDNSISFLAENQCFVGVNIGVRSSQVGITTPDGNVVDEDDFETPSDAKVALQLIRASIEKLASKNTKAEIRFIGVSVPGSTDQDKRTLISAPHLGWRNVDIAAALQIDEKVRVVVENNSTSAALFEAQVRINEPSNFILVRSGTGIGVGIVICGEVYRGTGAGRGISGEFGHMTIVAGGKSCVCGNRGCWEKYASAAAGASLYLGDRPPARGESIPRFVEIVAKAENGDNRSRRTLEKIGDYLGIGIANVIMGVGIPRVIISGRLVYGWEFIKGPMNEAIERSVVGKIDALSVEAGSPAGSGIGGAHEIALEGYLSLF